MEFAIGGDSIALTVPDQKALLAIIEQRLRGGQGFALATLNVDHLEKLRQDMAFRTAYTAHDLIVADGNPIVWLARLGGQNVSLVPGSDLVQPLCALAARLQVKVAIIAGTQDGGEDAACRLTARNPGLDIALVAAPGFPFDPNGTEADALLDRLNDIGATLCLLAVGAPRQEILAARGRDRCPHVGFASIGAGIDFVSGRQRRAPRLMRQAKIEWLWRAASNPKRLGPRYLRGAIILPGHALRALQSRWGQS